VLALRIPAAQRDRPFWIPLRGRKARLDWFCGAGAALGLVLLTAAHSPAMAAAAAVATDCLAFIPTALNGWRNPVSEFWPTYLLDSLAAALVLAAAFSRVQGHQLPTFTAVAFPLWLVAADGGTGLMIAARRVHTAGRRRRRGCADSAPELPANGQAASELEPVPQAKADAGGSRELLSGWNGCDHQRI
jgi:hypothetical protein